MIQFFIIALITIIKDLPSGNPAYLDILKVLIGSTIWIGGMLGYLYWREKNIKTSVSR